MMRWLARTGGYLLAICLVSGCTRQCFLDKATFDDAHSSLLAPSQETNYELGAKPLLALTAAPPTVMTPDRPPRYLSLQEAIALALENGTASYRTLSGANGPGSGSYDTNMFTAPPLTGPQGGNLANYTDYVRVLALNPAISGTDIEGALSRFDATWVTSMNWTVTDNLLQGLNSFSNGETAAFTTGLVKQLASGGFVSTSFSQNYQLLSSPPTTTFSILNPLYTSQVTIGFEQPLFRNFGTRINELLSGTSSPVTGIGVPSTLASLYGARQTQVLQSGGLITTDGILVARLRFDQQRVDFERTIQAMVLQVEVAYWNLYNAYGQLYSFEESLRVAHRAWMIAYAQLTAGKINAADYTPVRGQFEDFRTSRVTALGLVIENERNLRGIMGLQVEDGVRLVPVTPPTLARLQPDWQTSLQDALNLRPELILARDNLKLAQMSLEVAQNFLKPDIRFAAQYQPVGFGTTLQGTGILIDATGGSNPNNALRSLVSDHYNNWTVGLTGVVPIGYRLENAGVRAARAYLAQNYYLVKDQEQKATSVLFQEYAKLQEWYQRIEYNRNSRKAYAEAVDVRFKKILAGAALADISFLDFQSKLATAQANEYGAIAEYNNTLARFEWAKGTILKYNNVHIAEGPVPQCTAVRAVEHEKERTAAVLLATRPDPLTLPGRLALTKTIPPMETPQPLPFLERTVPPATTPEGAPEMLPQPQAQPSVPQIPLPTTPSARPPLSLGTPQGTVQQSSLQQNADRQSPERPSLAQPIVPAVGAEPAFRPGAATLPPLSRNSSNNTEPMAFISPPQAVRSEPSSVPTSAVIGTPQ